VANTYVVSGTCETKKLQDLLPGIITQLGPDNLEELKKIYASFAGADKSGVNMASLQAALESGAMGGATGGGDEDDVPDLVETNFEEVSNTATTSSSDPAAVLEKMD